MVTFYTVNHKNAFYAKAGGAIGGVGDSIVDAQRTVAGIRQGTFIDTIVTRLSGARVAPGGVPLSATVASVQTAGTAVTGVTMGSIGLGYGQAPTVTFSGGTSTVTAIGHAVMGSDGRIAAIMIDNGGVYSNFTGLTCTIASLTTTNALVSWVPFSTSFVQATATGASRTGTPGGITGALTGLVAGGGYPSWGASALITGGAGTGAYADSCTTNGAGALATPLTEINAGSGYTSDPAVQFLNSNDMTRGGIASTTCAHIANPGIGCSLIDSYVARLVNSQCDLIIVNVGTNDYSLCTQTSANFAATGPVPFKAAYNTIIQAGMAMVNKPTIVCIGLGPLTAALAWSPVTYPAGVNGRTLNSAGEVLADYNLAIQAVAKENNCAFVSLSEMNYANMGASSGNVHLNAIGSLFVANEISRALSSS